MIYLKSITIKEDYRNILNGLKIEFQDITLLVGEQGCGKSSLLNLLRDNKGFDYDCLPNINSYYFDTEKMNPRISDLNNYANPDGSSRGIGMRGALLSHFQSHGEVLREFTVNLLKESKENSVILLDEPECALSLRNQYKLADEIKKASAKSQLIISTHCLPLIESVKSVYNMETKQWVDSHNFIEHSKI